MIRHLADFASPLHATVHKTPFRWIETEDKAYEALKIMLMQAPVVQPRIGHDRSKFLWTPKASNIAIGSALMQHTDPNWYKLVYYSSRKLSTAEHNYSTKEREALGMIYHINKFRH